MEQDQESVPPLRIRVRPGAYACGTETIEHILRAALSVLVEEGSRAFTLRRIAAECGMKVGNLSYYFPRKEDLVQQLLEAILNGYADISAGLREGTVDQPEERLRRMIAFTLDDIRSKLTTNLFPELWALANHDEKVNALVQDFYARAQRGIASAVSAVNPRLDEEECCMVALFISATMEGTTIFAGYQKPWEGQMPQIKIMAVNSLLNLVKGLSPGDLRISKMRRTKQAA
ncbi:TetR/AcrR family transcriptional regulator [Sphingomonas bacterium]|uniref:TetR/AcrR family transcriptional regulator n=1 Tax=Sphingomonas bacterium TaxID=1895847 RepID=UPI0015750BD7|nr:TetR/AcrR family transcriptional regulator [Sphingomonas bacterium]